MRTRCILSILWQSLSTKPSTRKCVRDASFPVLPVRRATSPSTRKCVRDASGHDKQNNVCTPPSTRKCVRDASRFIRLVFPINWPSTRKCVRDASGYSEDGGMWRAPSTRKCVRDASAKCTHYLRSYTDYFVYLNLFECIANCKNADLPPLSRFRDGKSPHNAMRTLQKSAVHRRFAFLCFQRIFYDFFNSDNGNILRSVVIRVAFKAALRTMEFRL